MKWNKTRYNIIKIFLQIFLHIQFCKLKMERKKSQQYSFQVSESFFKACLKACCRRTRNNRGFMAVKVNGTMVTKRNKSGESIEVGSQGRDITLINMLNKLAEENRT